MYPWHLFLIYHILFWQVLDFDFERFCSVSLSNLNVYACLVCGKYYQGRGKKSHAYTHSLEAGHHVYINLQTEKVYCLPDGYEISDPSLDDIRHVLNPRFVYIRCIFFHLYPFSFVCVTSQLLLHSSLSFRCIFLCKHITSGYYLYRVTHWSCHFCTIMFVLKWIVGQFLKFLVIS